MFSRIRIALGLALLLTLLTSINALAKGEFSFIAVSGAELKNEVRISDPALTGDFFAFADFYRDKTDAPLKPGIGYEITRYYLDGSREIAFDKLHYYPETGYVYYDGIVNGSSEYDQKWYISRPEVKSNFETALVTELRLKVLGTEEGSRSMVPPPQAAHPEDQSHASISMILQTQAFRVVVLSLMVILLAGFLGFRRLSTR